MNREPWRTYLVTQESLSSGRSTQAIVEAAIEGGIDAIQLREKETSALARYELGGELRRLTADADVPLLVNDRVDLAAAIDADGVHVGQDDLPVEAARSILGTDAIVGCSASTVPEAEAAVEAGADYLGVGSVYGTTSKDVSDDRDGVGPDRIREIAESVEVPVIGIGGITPENAGAVIEAGADGVAVISAITAADDPARATAALQEAVANV